MHARNLARPKNPYHNPATSVYTALSFWKFSKSWSRFLECHRGPPARQDSHRHSTISTGHLLGHRHLKHCRPALNSAGRQKLPAEDSFDSNREQTAYGMGFQAHVSMVMFPIMCWTQGTWPSILEPSMVHDSPRDRACHLMKRMHATHKWGPRPYHVEVKGPGDRELRRVASLTVWTLLNPHTWFDTPNQVNAMHVMLTRLKCNMIPRCKAQQALCNQHDKCIMPSIQDANMMQIWTNLGMGFKCYEAWWNNHTTNMKQACDGGLEP